MKIHHFNGILQGKIGIFMGYVSFREGNQKNVRHFLQLQVAALSTLNLVQADGVNAGRPWLMTGQPGKGSPLTDPP